MGGQGGGERGREEKGEREVEEMERGDGVEGERDRERE